MITDIPCADCGRPVRVRRADGSPEPTVLCLACTVSRSRDEEVAARRSGRNRRDAERQAHYRTLMERLEAAEWLLRGLRNRLARDRAYVTQYGTFTASSQSFGTTDFSQFHPGDTY